MSRFELIKIVSERTNLTKKDTEKVIVELLNVIEESLASGRKVRLNNFGSFDVVSRAPRIARNPHTGEAIRIEARKVPFFKPGKQLKEKVGALSDM